ncbi:MAG: glycosyltransferase family 2 protein [Actinomycetes bacterium]
MRKISHITVMTPAFNEESGIEECVIAVKRVFEEELIGIQLTHLIIDNGSTDKTVEVLREIIKTNPQVKVIVNSRNFGPHKSPYHGTLLMEGDAVIPLVADLQTPPDLIPAMVRLWEQGFDVVAAVRAEMKEGLFTRFTRNIYYKILSKLTGANQISHFIGFGLFDKKVIDALRMFDDPEPYFRGLISEVGFKQTTVVYSQPERKHGKSRQNIWDKVDYASLGLTKSSSRPLFILVIFAVALGAASILLAALFTIAKLIWWNYFAVGIIPILILMLFLGAVQLLSLGLIGLYVNVILQQVRYRPHVVELERINFSKHGDES